jgi:2-polyprenyl-3-methyl-5-hydroxy-6-metoxy-1,4-benzoquinol methylase
MVLTGFERRVDVPELMDTTPLSAEELDHTLRFLERSNKYLGGYGLVFGYLDAWLARRPARSLSILDVGTGGGDLPVALVLWGRRRGVRVRAVGLDSDPAIAAWARRRVAGEYGDAGVEIRQATLEETVRSGQRFDFVTASLVLHHVPESGLVPFLRALDAVAQRGVIVSDLSRDAASWLGAWLVTAVAGNRITRHDGPVSVRRAFTPEELRALAAEAGLPYLSARRHALFRLALAGEKP